MKVLRVTVQMTLFMAVLYYIGKTLSKSLQEVSWQEVYFEPVMMVCSILSVSAVMVFMAAMNQAIFSSMGHAPHWAVTAAATWLSRVGKYLPGKVMSVVGLAYFLRSFGIPTTLAARAAILGDALMIFVGFIVSAPLMFMEPMKPQMLVGLVCGGIALVGWVIAIYPGIIVLMLNFVLRLTGHELLAASPSTKHFAMPVFYMLAQWIFTGFAVWCLARSVSGVSLGSVPLFVSAATLGGIVGFLVIFAPGGLGVREGVLLTILSPVIGAGTAAIVAIASRLIMLFTEVVLAAIGFYILMTSDKTATQ